MRQYIKLNFQALKITKETRHREFRRMSILLFNYNK